MVLIIKFKGLSQCISPQVFSCSKNLGYFLDFTGDQIVEWNGVPLTGRTYEDVQHIISIPNGEIELLIRP